MGEGENLVFFFVPVNTSTLFENVHVLVFEKSMIFSKKDVRESAPIVLIIKGFNSTKFNITNKEPNEKPSLVLVP